jgi:Holliday junction resolvase
VRRRAASDGNQPEIVAALRGIGATVVACHAVGAGFPDLVVGYRGRNFLIEVKDPAQPKHRHELTPAQVEFHGGWKGQIAKVFTAQQALAVVLGPDAQPVPFRGQINA